MICIVHLGSEKTPEISKALSALEFDNETIKEKEVEGTNFSKFSGIILGGSPTYFTEVDHQPYHQKFDFIKSTSTPVLGICFGHQLLGILHGAKIFRGKEARTSIKIDVLKNDILFKDLENNVIMAEDHTEGINLPDGFVHLATSPDYPVEAMRHHQKNLFGVQFHPEISEEPGRILLRNFCELCQTISNK